MVDKVYSNGNFYCSGYEVAKKHQNTRMIRICPCGENIICPDCGYGWGSYPCGCDNVDIPKERSKHEDKRNDMFSSWRLL